GAGSRDPRRAKWGQSNGPQQQQQPQQHPTGSQYSPQGGGQRRGGPSGWQASNNPGNYNSYNPGGNPNGGNTNNNNPGWINNNNNNGHFINGSPNFNYNNRPMFNRATSLGGGVSNAPQGPGNNNINGPPYSGAPRTYREHLAAKAKQQEMQRQLEANEKQRQHEAAEKQRQLEAAEKQRQLEADEKQRQLEAAEKQRQLDAAAAAEKKRKLQEAEKQLDDGQAVAAPSRMESDNVQLDTSYRNVVLTGTTNKKLDFKIPKKASLEKVSRTNEVRSQNSDKTNKCEESIGVDNNNSEEQSSSKSNKTNKSSKSHKVAKTVHFDKEKSDSAEKVPKSDKTVDKEKADKSKKVVRVDKADTDKTDNSDGKHNSCSAAKKNKSENKKDEDVDETSNKPETPEKEKTKHSSNDKSPAEKSNSTENKEKKKPTADNTDNVENEPPSVVETHEQQLANKKSEVESADSDQMSAKRNRSQSKHPKGSKSTASPTRKDDEPQETAVEDDPVPTVAQPNVEQNAEHHAIECKQEKVGSEGMPKLPKLKVVLGPNAHAMVVIPSDAINTTKSPLKEMPELKRILKRRKSMMPTASKPLVDKSELFGGVSLNYEDLVDHRREQQQLNASDEVTAEKIEVAQSSQQRVNRNLAIMFEKTSDNCSISTQNILAGKRRSRLNELTLNETQLSRNVFNPPTIRPKRDSSKAAANADSPKRKRGRPRKDPDESPDKPVNQPAAKAAVPPALASDAENLLPPPPKKKSKRSELEKLNDDIAQMYYANDVIHATGRRACSAQRRGSSTSSSISNSTSAEFAPYIRNVARRGRHYEAGRGFNRAAFKAQQVLRRKTNKKLRVRVARCAQLEHMLKESKKENNSARTKNATCLVKNVNPEWHSQSSAVTSCVICAQEVRFAMSHYVQHHGEFYGARLPPNELENLRAGKLTRPIYRTNGSLPKYNHVCVFCQKQLEIANTSWVEHYARHTGEFKFQCSSCKSPRYRQHEGDQHVLKCKPGARLIALPSYRRTLPVVIYVCRLCNFCQLSQQNLKKHLQVHHEISEPTQMDLNQQLTIYTTENVPAANSKAAAKRLIARHKSEMAKLNKKKQSPTSKTNPKVRTKPISKKAKTEPPEQANSQPVTEQQKESMGSVTLGMPPTRPDEEQLLVINECKLEQSDYLQSSSQAERVKDTTMPPVEAESDSDVDVEEVPEVAQQPEPEKEVEQPQQVEQQVEQQAQVAIEQADEEMSESQPDANQDLDQQQTSEQNIEQQQVLGVDVDMGVEQEPHVEEQKENELEPDEEEELTSEQRRKGSCSSNKSLFRNFNKFCNKLKSRGSRSSTSSSTNSIGSASGSNVKGKPSNSPDHSSLECEVPELNSQPEVIVDLPSAPTVSPSETEIIPIQYMICVQNVAFRLRGSPTLKPAYYCRVPDCLFLFSNEIEGLENHFTRSHPSLRWNGSCTECSLPVKEVPDNLSIREELQHMALVHVAEIVAPKPPEPAVEVAPPEPVLPKLRVRRFTGDRLVPEAEQAIGIESEAVPREPIDENTTLRSLLLAQSRPPSHQQQQLNAAGVGEFLCAKTPPTTVDVPDVINRDSELGLQINHVYSLADTSIPLITGETVPLPVATNDDFVITQSLTQNYEGPIPAEINISIEHRPTSSPPRKDRTQIAGNRFRCMAPNCNYCSHTVMCIREHMKFHSFSFGPKDYLQCSYCTHVGKDVDEYVQHGVLQHGLASREELQEPNLSTSVALSQRIRDVLKERRAPLALSTSAATASDTNQTIILTTLDEATTNVAEANNNTLYACPFKGCNVNLTEEAFVNHVRYHKSSNPNAGPLICKFCSQMFEKPIALRSHLQHMHHRHEYFCSICLETTVDQRLMLQHVRAVHNSEFQKLNCQQHFLDLTAAFDGVAMPKCWVSAMEQPFAQKQMEDFLSRLIEELRLRRTNNKLIYRPSEMHLIAKTHGGGQGQLHCGECQHLTYSKDLYNHLLQHRELAVRLAYPPEEAIPDVRQPNQQELVTTVEASTSAQSVAQPNAGEVELPIAPVAGRQIVVTPRFHFVRKEVRYKCGVPDCGQHFDTELGLSQHLSTQHSYGDGFKCPHCRYEDHLLILEKVLEHLKYHKRYVYQCGACSSFAPKRSLIDRHIHIKHASKLGADVDVIIHKRDDLTMHTKLAAVRWFKSLNLPHTSTDEWFCNLCHAVLATEQQMIGHTAVAHQRMYQYCCPYCDFGYKDLTRIINHIRRSHASKRIQPLQCYLRIKCKNRQTLGFICNTCHETTNSLHKMSNHCLQVHLNRFQYKCRHCDFGHTQHRPVAAHMTQEHPGLPGLPIQQFDRLSNDMPDDDFWNLAQIFSSKGHVEPPEAIASNNQAQAIQIFEPIELSSDEEDDQTNNAASAQKQYEFACSHCTETRHNIDELRSQHWAIKHPEHPFYFCVQPQLCCPVCYGFKGSAKALLEEHLPNVHHRRTLVACDVRQMRECGYCDKTYKEWPELVQHMTIEAHLANDLKNLTDGELNELIEMGSTENEYYQCNLCRVLMPSSVAIAQHGTVEHSDAEDTFSFRLVKNTIIYHCSFCMYASVDELETLRHMLDHCKRFGTCHLCAEHLNSGFDEYIQHCYSSHRDQVDNFDVIHPYDDLKKFLMQVLYQFQNGLIISKSSLRDTRFSHERAIHQLYNELRSKAAKPPIPRMLFSQLQSRNVTATLQLNTTTTSTPTTMPRIQQRRKTLNPNDMQQLFTQQQQQQ
ncbi:hypothetical protein KR215_010701, partial [Drosophila sulfurigaster]